MEIRRLQPGDETVLAALARADARAPLAGDAAAAYLADLRVLHWVAELDGDVVGHLLCHVERRRSGAAEQLLLYEIDVREPFRRRGVGRALVAEMEQWMRAHGVREVWVLADNAGAEAFYAACGFARDDVQPVQMTLTLPAP